MAVMKVFSGLAASSQAHLRVLVALPLQPVAELGAAVEGYLEHLEQILPAHDYLDITLARDVGRALLGLVERLGPNPDPAARQALQAAVHYFVLSDDAKSDVDSLLGFDDDALVSNAVARYLGAPDLEVRLPE